MLPIQAKHRSGGCRLVRADEPEVDLVLIYIVKGVTWLAELDAGTMNVRALAKKHGIDESYLRKHVQLGMLPPGEIELMLCEGCGLGGCLRGMLGFGDVDSI
ncbi:MAG: hypothetical protein HRU15_03145 [Planctomycetes bacterium]|nr:hypothetical protein [Planctomycetota bacterium]